MNTYCDKKKTATNMNNYYDKKPATNMNNYYDKTSNQHD